MPNMKFSAARRLLAHPLPVATMLVSGALALGGCATSSEEAHVAKPAAETATVSHQEGSSLQFLADQMAKQGKYEAAIPLYRRAHALHPRDAGPLMGLGSALVAVGANSEAADALQAAHDRDSDDAAITVKLADLYLAINRPELALPLYDEALAKDPHNAAAMNGKAVAQDVTGDHQGAQTTYQAGLAADPDNMKLQSNLGLSLALNGKTNESIQMLENAATSAQGGPSERQNLALAYAFAGRNEDALKVASIDVDPVTAHEDLAYFSDLKAMKPDDRASALMSGVRQPKQNTDHPANLGFGADEDQAKETIKRVVGSPSVAIEPLEQPAQAEAKPAPEEKPIQKAVAQVTAPITEVPPLLGDEGYAVQIAAYRKAQQLVSGWNILHQRYVDLIGTLSPRRSEVDFGKRDEDPSGFFYRLNAGPLTTYEEASQICKEIQSRGGPCWVRSPEPAEGHLPGAVPAAPPRTASTGAPDQALLDQAAKDQAAQDQTASAQGGASRSSSSQSSSSQAASSQTSSGQASAGTGKAKLDVDALVKNQSAEPKKAATVWEQVGSSESDAGGAAATPQNAANGGDAADENTQPSGGDQEEAPDQDEFSADPPGQAQ